MSMSMSETKIWVTKYALTTGILEFEESPRSSRNGGSVLVTDPTGMNGTRMFHGRDWHLSLESALVRAEEMRLTRIASLRKSLKEMEALRFDGGK